MALSPKTLVTSCSHNGLSGNGTVHVLLTDAPLDLTGVTAVNVTVGELSLRTVEDADGAIVHAELHRIREAVEHVHR